MDKRRLTNEEKKLIADLYHNTRASIGMIAQTVGHCKDTINRYKNYGY